MDPVRFQPPSNRPWQLQPYGSGFRVKDTIKELSTLPPQLGKAAEARCVSRVSLHGSLEWPLHEAVELKARLF